MDFTPTTIAAMLKRKTITSQEASYLLSNPGFSGSLASLRSVRANGPNTIQRTELTRTNVDHPFMFIFSNYGKFTEPADFGSWADRMDLPVAPAQFDYSIKNNAQTFTAMSGKTFSHAGAEDLLRVSFDTFLPAGLTSGDVEIPTYVYQSVEFGLFEPTEFVEKIQAAQAANQPFYFSIIQSKGTPDGVEIIPPTPMTVQDFTPSYSAGQGHDISFSISLQLWNPQVQAMTSGTKVYVTRPGDRYSCGNIALSQLGSVARYKEIKALNKAVLDGDHKIRLAQAARGLPVRADFITPGTRLMIPANKTSSSAGAIGAVPSGTSAPIG